MTSIYLHREGQILYDAVVAQHHYERRRSFAPRHRYGNDVYYWPAHVAHEWALFEDRVMDAWAALRGIQMCEACGLTPSQEASE